MDWSNEIVFEFLNWYENEPVIWNASLSNHKNRNEVYDAWKRIEINMGQKYNVTELKKKKDSLMASFRACLNKVKQSINSGAGIEDVYKPQWFAYEKMASFLRDKDQQKNTMNTEDILSEEGCDNDEAEEEDISETGGLGRDDIQNDALMLPSGSKSVFKTPLRKRRKMVDADELKDKINNAYCILQGAVNIPAKEKNVSSIYGELVAAKLQSMDERTRDICMHRIDNILFEMKMNSSTLSDNFYQLYPTQELNIACTPTPTYPQSSPSSTSQSSIISDHAFSRHSQSPSPQEIVFQSNNARAKISQCHKDINPTTPQTLSPRQNMKNAIPRKRKKTAHQRTSSRERERSTSRGKE